MLDDESAINNNPSIRRLSSVGEVLFPTNDTTTRGRPLLNLSFALNYAADGTAVRGYHAVNLAIHVLATLVLFGVVRRTFALPQLEEKFGSAATPLAFAIAALWTLHPLLTESVTYLSQRAEALMGLCYLGTLYFFIRGATASAPMAMYGLAIAVCALGMMCKEVMVSAPLLVLLYDRTFLAGSFKASWQKRRSFYLGLAATWLVLAGLFASFQITSRGIGYDDRFTWWTYALTECKVVVDYLRLTLWPHPLIFDYGPELRISAVGEIVPYAVLLVLLLGTTAVSLRHWPALGFLGAWFFLILAPTSSIVPVVTMPMAESRLYLPLAGIVTLVAVTLYAWLGRKSLGVLLALAIGLGVLTERRNHDYRDQLAIWSDTIAKRAENSRAQNALGHAFSEIPGHENEAIAHYEIALQLDPYHARAHGNLARLLVQSPTTLSEGIKHYEDSIRLEPTLAETHYNFANTLAQLPGRLPEAIVQYEEAIRLDPDFAVAHVNLANALSMMPGRLSDMVAHYQAALRIQPNLFEAYYNMGVALSDDPARHSEAIASLEAALRVRPDSARARQMLTELRGR